MNYVISDIHGCYQELRNVISKIDFTDKDMLYVLGDIVDRGLYPMKALQYIMGLNNAVFIMGNHDYMLYYFMKKLGLNWSTEALAQCEETVLYDFQVWLEDGGNTTMKDFISLSKKEKEEVYRFFQMASYFQKIEYEEKTYILVHAGIKDFVESKKLSEYENTDFLFERAMYETRYFDDLNTYFITGHTPTAQIRKDNMAKVYEENGHIAIDCGCVYGGKLAIYCLDNGSVIYSD